MCSEIKGASCCEVERINDGVMRTSDIHKVKFLFQLLVKLHIMCALCMQVSVTILLSQTKMYYLSQSVIFKSFKYDRLTAF